MLLTYEESFFFSFILSNTQEKKTYLIFKQTNKHLVLNVYMYAFFKRWFFLTLFFKKRKMARMVPFFLVVLSCFHSCLFYETSSHVQFFCTSNMLHCQQIMNKLNQLCIHRVELFQGSFIVLLKRRSTT